MRKSKIFHTLVIIHLILFSSTTKAAQNDIDFDKQILRSDAIILGTVTSMVSRISKVGNAYTVSSIGDASQLTANGEIPILEEVPIYSWGGVIPNSDYMPGNGSFKFKVSYMAGSPRIRISDRVIIFITGNGMSDIPFVGNESGVLKVSSSGHVTNNSGQNINYLGSTLGIVRSDRIRAILRSSSSRIDEYTQEELRAQGDYVYLPELIEYVVKKRSESSIQETYNVRDLVDVVPTSEAYK